jgi:hypothetical protein
LHPSDLDLDALLQDPGNLEAQAHLVGCPPCAARLRERRAVQALLQELEPVEPSELEWKRIDRHVLEAVERRAEARQAQRSWLVIAVPVLAAVAAGLVIAVKLVTVAHAPRPAIPIAEVVAPAQAAVALAIGGDAHTGRSGPEILEGDLLDAAQGTLQIQTAPATGIDLAPGTRARATRLRTGDTAFALEQGTLRAEVRPLASGTHFTVRAGDLSVHVVGTQFVVVREAGQTRVSVVHGRVRVDREGADSMDVPAGSALNIPDGAMLSKLQLEPLGADGAAPFPLGFPELAPDEVERQYGQAEIVSEPAGARAALDGAARGLTPLTVLAAEGTHEVQLQLAGHQMQRHTLHVSRTRAQATLAMALVPPPAPVPTTTPEPTRKAASIPAPAVSVAPPPPATPVSFAEAFHGAAVSHRAEVQDCYRASGAELSRRLHVVLTIDPTGRVSPPVSIQEPGAEASFIDCINRAASRWSFPPPGREYEVAVPYELDAAR